jgi:ubiquinone/menaquinone biosynthesis C-methylase UbiE
MWVTLTKIFGVSGGHHIVSRAEAEQAQLEHQWQDPKLPERQWALVSQQLAEMRTSGQLPQMMQVLVDQLKSVSQPGMTVLETGCSSGYYSEIFQMAGLDVQYSGSDYSEAFINLAKQHYPQLAFQVGDAAKLPYQDREFDIVISGGVILHMLQYAQAIHEAARVSKRYVVFSRTPMLHTHATTYTIKQAYGVKSIEVLFNEAELFQHFRAAGLRVLALNTVGRGAKLFNLVRPVYVKTYLCERI